MKRLAAPVLAACACAAATAAEYVGDIVDGADVRVIRAGRPASLVRDKSLYAGDDLYTKRGGVVFEFCPEKSELTLGPDSHVTLGAKQVRFVTGKLAGRQSIETCSAPDVQLAAQSNVHPSLTGYRKIRISREAQAAPEPISGALKAELDRITTLDLRGRINRAVLYEQYGQPALAIKEYVGSPGTELEFAL